MDAFAISPCICHPACSGVTRGSRFSVNDTNFSISTATGVSTHDAPRITLTQTSEITSTAKCQMERDIHNVL